MKNILTFFFLFLCSLHISTGFAQDSRATLTIDKTEILIGEQLEATLKLSFPVTKNYNFALLHDTLSSKIEIVELGKIDTTYTGNNLGIKELSQKLWLTSFDTGFHTIPPILFAGQTDSIKSDPALVHVKDVEVKMPVQNGQQEAEIEIKDIKDIKEASFSLWEWIKENMNLIFLVLLLGVSIWAYIKYIHPRLKDKGIKEIISPKAIPPYIIAHEKLHELETKKLWQHGQIKLYHSDLSEIIREYIENQLFIPALESTTHEIVSALKEKKLNEETLTEINAVLQLSDLVKFAKMIPIGDENDRSIKLAYHFVDKTKPKEEVTEEEKIEHV